mgnify:CR=1 FL=1
MLNGQLWRGRHGNAAHLAVLPVTQGQLLLQQPDADAISTGLQAAMALLDIPLVIIDSSTARDLAPLLAGIALLRAELLARMLGAHRGERLQQRIARVRRDEVDPQRELIVDRGQLARTPGGELKYGRSTHAPVGDE